MYKNPTRGTKLTYLKRQLVSGMRPPIDNIETWDGHCVLLQIVACQFGIMRVERNAIGRRPGLGNGQGDSENRIRPQLCLILGSIQIDHELINVLLLGRVHADNGGSQNVIHVGYGLQDTLAQIPTPTVAQFDRLVGTRGSTGWDRCTKETIVRHDFHLVAFVVRPSECQCKCDVVAYKCRLVDVPRRLDSHASQESPEPGQI